MRVLVACEFSGTVRNAFINAGHDAMSCDLLPTDQPDPLGNDDCHYQGDIFELLADKDYEFDLMIAHPPCTDLAVSGAKWFKEKRADGRQQASLEFVRKLLQANIPMIALENPISIISSQIRKPDQIIQPWMFGHGETKATCLWLKNLPLLQPTNIVEGRADRIHKMPPSPDRWKERSKTYPGIADAFAMQWGIW
jgi:site-specific DNA-cytosine methylase